ncbi:hypothetical protein LCGC14_0346250 [marine sediment metagenome]|uniref:Uncharacterized protein n=1 Tax=marine sediment metagenome TaxID=412755 RepID=A0A0F9WK59_9ZZZZ
MEVKQVADRIESIVIEIGKFRKQIEGKGAERAKAISNYDMRLGIAIVTLKDEGKFPATLIEKIAKKVCAPDRERLELAESGYKACISNLTALMAQLNGYQSIYRHLDST